MTEEVTLWLRRLSQGDERAAEEIWNCYFDKLVRLAEKKLGTVRREADEEDIALSAMKSFYRGARSGEYSRLANRHDLWKLLVTITVRKALQQQRRHLRQKRGSGQVRGESAFRGNVADDAGTGIEQILGSEPTPDLAAQFAECVEQRMKQLPDDSLRNVALLKMQGCTNAEIGRRLKRHEGTIERKLKLIRRVWESAVA